MKNQEKSISTVDLIKADMLRSGFAPPVLVSSTALTVGSSLINSSDFQGYVALSFDKLVLFRNTFPIGDYSHLITLNLNDITCLKSGVKLILRQPYVKLQCGKYRIEITGLTQEMVDLICKYCC